MFFPQNSQNVNPGKTKEKIESNLLTRESVGSQKASLGTELKVRNNDRERMTC